MDIFDLSLEIEIFSLNKEIKGIYVDGFTLINKGILMDIPVRLKVIVKNYYGPIDVITIDIMLTYNIVGLYNSELIL